MVAGQNEHVCAGEPGEHGDDVLHVALRHGGPVEQIAGHDEEVSLPCVGFGDDAFQSLDPLGDEPAAHLRFARIPLVCDAHVVVGGVDDADRHGLRLRKVQGVSREGWRAL